jgi:hypothetical protein
MDFDANDDSAFKHADDGEVDVHYEADNDGKVHDIEDDSRNDDDNN